MGLGRAQNWYYNPANGKWELRGKTGVVLARVSESGVGFGADGQELTRIIFLTGTTPLANVGTQAQLVATITNMTGVAVGDFVMATPKAALVADVVQAFARVATTDTVHVGLQSVDSTGVGSQPAVGWDVVAFRKV